MRGACLTFANEMFAADSYTELLGFSEEDRMLVRRVVAEVRE